MQKRITSKCIYINAYTHTHTHIYIYMCTYVDVYIYIYIYILEPSCVWLNVIERVSAKLLKRRLNDLQDSWFGSGARMFKNRNWPLRFVVWCSDVREQKLTSKTRGLVFGCSRAEIDLQDSWFVVRMFESRNWPPRLVVWCSDVREQKSTSKTRGLVLGCSRVEIDRPSYSALVGCTESGAYEIATQREMGYVFCWKSLDVQHCRGEIELANRVWNLRNVYKYINVYIEIFVYKCIYIYVYTCMCIYIYRYVYVFVYIYRYVYMCVCIYICIYECIYIYICVCVYISVYIYI